MVNRIVSADETFTLPPPVRAKLVADLTASSPGDILAALAHNPAVQEQYEGNVAGATFAALSPGSLLVTFTAPSTGRVSVQLEAQIQACSETGFWALQESGAVVPGTAVRVCGAVAPNAGGRASATVLAGGLTPGVSYTYTWASAAPGTVGSFLVRAGGSGATVGWGISGPAVMIVRTAPTA